MGDTGDGTRGTTQDTARDTAPGPPRIGPYEVVAELGSGGMGTVHLALDPRGAPVAVKVLRGELAQDPGMLRRFAREARAASAAEGPGVAAVRGYDLDGPVPWIAAEYLAGPTLQQAVAACGPLAGRPATVGDLAAALARALVTVHGAGLVHRDVKPGNVVLTRTGPRLIDFGIARPEHGLTLTDPGTAPATPGFAPPEQVTGRRSGPPADVFAFGAVLVFVCTGRGPFGAGHPAGVNFRAVHEEPDLTGVPERYASLARRCLAKNPADRPTATDLVRELGGERGHGTPWRRGDPLAAFIRAYAARAEADLAAARPAAAPGLTRRHALGAGAAALVAAGGTTAAWLLRGDRDRTPRTSPYGIPYAAPVAHPTAGVAPRALWQVDGLAKDGPGPLATGPVVVAGHDPGLSAWTQDTGRPAWTWRGAPLGPLLTAGQGRTPLLLVADGAGGVTALNTRTGKRSWSASGDPGVRLLAADDHSLYVLGANRRVTALALDAEGRTRWTSTYRAGGKAPVAAVVARDRLLVVTREGTAVALNTATGARSWDKDLGGPLLGAPEVPTAPAAAAGVFCVGGSSLTVLDATHGKVRWSHPAEDVGAWAAPLVADGAVYAARQGDLEEGELAACDLTDGAPRWTCRLRFAAELVGDPPVPGGPAVLEGNALVIPLGAERKAVLDTSRTDLGIATLDARTGRLLWTRTDDDPWIGWHLTAAAGRVFTHRKTRLTAHPSL